MQPWHNDLIWNERVLLRPMSSVPDAMNYGPWFNYVHAPYSFGICFLALGLLIADSMQRDTLSDRIRSIWLLMPRL